MAYMQRNPFTGHPMTNTFATGDKRYGPAQSTQATTGSLASTDGYDERSRKMLMRRRALQNRLRQGSGLAAPNPEQGI